MPEDTTPETVENALENALRDTGHPVASTQTVANNLSIGRKRVKQILDALELAGRVESVNVGPATAWYIPNVPPKIPSNEPTTEPENEPPTEPENEPTTEPENEPPTEPENEPLTRSSSPSIELPNEIDDRIWGAVKSVSESWNNDGRLHAREHAAAHALQYALETTEHIGRSSPVIKSIQNEYPVDEQNLETYWRNNIRGVLSEYGTYSRGKHGYQINESDLP